MPFNTWKEVYDAAALGDEEATTLLGQRQESIDQRVSEVSESERVRVAEQRARDAETEKNLFIQNTREKTALEEEMGISVRTDPEAYALAVQYDSNLYRANPDMPFKQRAKIAYQAALEQLGPQEDRDYASAIAARAKVAGKEPVLHLDKSRQVSTFDAEQARVDADIREMNADYFRDRAAARGRLVQQGVEETGPQRPKPQRQTPHVAPDFSPRVYPAR